MIPNAMPISVISADVLSDIITNGAPSLSAPYLSDFFSYMSETSNHKSLQDWYYRGDDIIKTSIGDFYDETICYLLNKVTELNSILSGTIEDTDRLAFLAKFIPLAFTNPNEPLSLTGSRQKIQQHIHNALTEVDVVLKSLWRPYDINAAEKTDQSKLCETVATRICAKYPPYIDTPLLQECWSGREEVLVNALAALLYPNTMHPMLQLRPMVYTLTPDLRNDLKELLYETDHAVGQLLTFDVLGDFITYSNFAACPSIKVVRQYATPFSEFLLSGDFDDKDLAVITPVIEDCVEKSTRLYQEIVKTGLTYNAQHATLAGFMMRFHVSGTFSEYRKALDRLLALKDISKYTKNIAEGMEKSLAHAMGEGTQN